MVEVEVLAPDREPAYRSFLSRCEHALIYYSLEYRDFLLDVAGGTPRYLVAWRNDTIVGVLPCFSLPCSGFGRVVNSLPWYGSHGGCLLVDEQDDEVRNALVGWYAEFIGAPDVLAATTVLSHGENKYLPAYVRLLSPRFEDSRIGQITELPEMTNDCEQVLLKRFSQKTRNLVRKSLKQDFSVLTSDQPWAWRFLCETHSETMRALGGSPKPWSHFQAMRSRLGNQCRSLFVAVLEGTPVAALLLLYFNKTVEYFVPVIKNDFRPRQPLSFLIYHAMIDAVAQGFRWWNWGGTWSSQRSLHHFKAGWAAQDLIYTYLIRASDRMMQLVDEDREKVAAAFPYYYLIPFTQR